MTDTKEESKSLKADWQQRVDNTLIFTRLSTAKQNRILKDSFELKLELKK